MDKWSKYFGTMDEIGIEFGENSEDSSLGRRLTVESNFPDTNKDESIDIESRVSNLENLIKVLQDELVEIAKRSDQPEIKNVSADRLNLNANGSFTVTSLKQSEDTISAIQKNFMTLWNENHDNQKDNNDVKNQDIVEREAKDHIQLNDSEIKAEENCEGKKDLQDTKTDSFGAETAAESVQPLNN